MSIPQPLSTKSKILHRLHEPHSTIVDLVNERDRAFFEEHPNEANYLRPSIPGELPDVVGVHTLDIWILVHNIAPGVRCREPVGEIVGSRPLPARIALTLPDGTLYKDVPVVGGGAL